MYYYTGLKWFWNKNVIFQKSFNLFNIFYKINPFNVKKFWGVKPHDILQTELTKKKSNVYIRGVTVLGYKQKQKMYPNHRGAELGPH